MTNTPLDMNDVRANVLERILAKLALRETLQIAYQQLAAHDVDALLNNGRQNIKADVNHLIGHILLLQYVVETDTWADIEQFAFLFARDVLVETVRQGGGRREPVVWLTGNRFAPAFRSFDELDAIWHADSEGTYIVELWERIERKCDELQVLISYPEDDNSIYGVDLSKWERSEAAEKDEPIDDINDEWSWRDPEPVPPVSKDSYNPTGYRLGVETLSKAVQAGGQTFEVGQYVKFKHDLTELHIVTDIGRDSDNDVWVMLDNDGKAFFDWDDLLIPATKEG